MTPAKFVKLWGPILESFDKIDLRKCTQSDIRHVIGLGFPAHTFSKIVTTSLHPNWARIINVRLCVISKTIEKERNSPEILKLILQIFRRKIFPQISLHHYIPSKSSENFTTWPSFFTTWQKFFTTHHYMPPKSFSKNTQKKKNLPGFHYITTSLHRL